MLWQVSAPKGKEDSGRRVAVLTHPRRPAAIASAVRLVEGLSAAGIDIAMPAEDLAGLGTPYDVMVRKLTGADLQQAARLYFNTGNYARFVLLPEKPAGN